LKRFLDIINNLNLDIYLQAVWCMYLSWTGNFLQALISWTWNDYAETTTMYKSCSKMGNKIENRCNNSLFKHCRYSHMWCIQFTEHFIVKWVWLIWAVMLYFDSVYGHQENATDQGLRSWACF
jgi:hypothetical protein